MDIALIDPQIAPAMADVDRQITRILSADHPFLAELNRRITETPGKRLRPKLLLLCAHMLGYHKQDSSLYGAIFELIHTATLVHDDVIDGASVRRGRPTLNSEMDNTLTVLYGDLLYTRAHAAAIEAGSLKVLATITLASQKMIEGELLQAGVNYDLKIEEETYFDILYRKTAYLFAGTTRSAAQIADRDEATCSALYTFGFQFGISFQLMDDYLDYVSTEETMGKPVLSDLRGGKVTLPVIRALAADEGKLAAAIEDFWANPDQAVPRLLIEAIHKGGGLAETQKLAADAAQKAVAALAEMPDNEYTTFLRAMPTFMLERMK